MNSRKKLPIAVLISGSGSTLKNLIDRISTGLLDVEIRLVVASRPDAGGIKYAEQNGIPFQVISRRSYPDSETFRDAMFAELRKCELQAVVMGGYLQHLLIPDDFMFRVINIHPSLIPSFCGKGYYGLAVHQAAIDYGVKVSGCTVHFVDNQYDHGPIIAQKVCSVEPADSAESLQQRVGELERELLPDVLQAFAENRIAVLADQRTISVMP